MGSLRQALLDANGAAGSNSIHFAIPSGTPPYTITPATTLPPITASGLSIDGTSQPGYAGAPIVLIDGHMLAPGASDLTSSANGVSVNAMSLTKAPSYGVSFAGASGDFIMNGLITNNGQGGVNLSGANAIFQSPDFGNMGPPIVQSAPVNTPPTISSEMFSGGSVTFSGTFQAPATGDYVGDAFSNPAGCTGSRDLTHLLGTKLVHASGPGSTSFSFTESGVPTSDTQAAATFTANNGSSGTTPSPSCPATGATGSTGSTGSTGTTGATGNGNADSAKMSKEACDKYGPIVIGFPGLDCRYDFAVSTEFSGGLIGKSANFTVTIKNLGLYLSTFPSHLLIDGFPATFVDNKVYLPTVVHPTLVRLRATGCDLICVDGHVLVCAVLPIAPGQEVIEHLEVDLSDSGAQSIIADAASGGSGHVQIVGGINCTQFEIRCNNNVGLATGELAKAGNPLVILDQPPSSADQLDQLSGTTESNNATQATVSRRAHSKHRVKVSRIEIAVLRTSAGAHAAAKAAPACQWLADAHAHFTPETPDAISRVCSHFVWLRARGIKRWLYRLRHKLPPGHYTIYARPTVNGRPLENFRTGRNRLSFTLR